MSCIGDLFEVKTRYKGTFFVCGECPFVVKKQHFVVSFDDVLIAS